MSPDSPLCSPDDITNDKNSEIKIGIGPGAVAYDGNPNTQEDHPGDLRVCG